MATRLVSEDGQMFALTEQDCAPILDWNHMLRAEPQKSDWGRHIASIPVVIITNWLNEEYARGNTSIRWGSKELDELVARKLKDPEWANLRVDR